MTVVLTPIDGSARARAAIPWAARLAGREGTVLLLRVLAPKSGHRASRLTAVGPDDGTESQGGDDPAYSAARAELDEAARVLAGASVAIDRLVAYGEPDEEIVAAAAERGADLIAMTSSGRGAIGRAVFGSVADRVARTARVPVLVVRASGEVAGESASITRLLVPLDGSEIAERALPVAIDLAHRLGTPVHVVRAIDPVATMPVTPAAFGTAPTVSAEIADRLWQEAESEARTTVADALTRLEESGVDATGGVLNGSPFFAISEATRPGDLIVLTSHGRSGVRRWLMGSVAEKLVREAPVPVLLVPAIERGHGDVRS